MHCLQIDPIYYIASLKEYSRNCGNLNLQDWRKTKLFDFIDLVVNEMSYVCHWIWVILSYVSICYISCMMLQLLWHQLMLWLVDVPTNEPWLEIEGKPPGSSITTQLLDSGYRP